MINGENKAIIRIGYPKRLLTTMDFRNSPAQVLGMVHILEDNREVAAEQHSFANCVLQVFRRSRRILMSVSTPSSEISSGQRAHSCA